MIPTYLKKLRLVIKRIREEKWMHRYLLQTILFNFKYLPLRQAVHLPVFLRKADVKGFKGSIKINSNVEPGMISLGRHTITIFSDTGITINGEGEIVFENRADIGSSSFLSINKGSKLFIGDKFCVTSRWRVACFDSITIGKNVLIGWDCLFQDSDSHQLCTPEGKLLGKERAPIVIGDNCWFAQRCTVFKGVTIPTRTIVASNSLLNKSYDIPSYCMLAGTPARVVKENVMLHH